MTYNIKCITTTEEFQNLEKNWKHLEKDSKNRNFTSTFDWQLTWWDVFKNRYDSQFGHNKELRILLLKKDTRIIGIAPLVKVTRKTRYLIDKTSIEFIGQQWAACFLDFIGDLNKIEVDYIIQWLYENDKFDYILLSYIPEWTKIFNINNQNMFVFSACPQIDSKKFQNYEEYVYKQYDGNFRRNLKRRSRKICRDFGEISFSQYTGIDIEVFNSIIQISYTKKQDQKHTIYEDSLQNIFISDLFNKDKTIIFTLNIEEKPAAYQICYTCNNTANLLDFAYDRQYRSYSIGTILEDFVVKYFLHKNMAINFGTGMSYYKSKFTSEFVRIYNYLLKGNSFKSFFTFPTMKNKFYKRSQLFQAELESSHN